MSEVGYRSIDSGKWIRELREWRSVKSGDIERISRAIAEIKGSPDFYISHSTLCDIETGSVPSVHKLFSLAGCLKVSLEELLLAFGIDITELRQHSTQSEPGLVRCAQFEIREPSFHFQLNFDRGLESSETRLLRLNPKDVLGLFRSPLHKYVDPARYRYAVIGSEDETMGDLLPPRSLVEIDVMQNAVQKSGWSSLHARPIYLVSHKKGHSCSWCQVQGNEPHPLTLPSLSPSR